MPLDTGAFSRDLYFVDGFALLNYLSMDHLFATNPQMGGK